MGSVWVDGNEYWTLDDLDAAAEQIEKQGVKCPYRVAISERGPGKSYSVKKKIFDNWMYDGSQGGVVRRFDTENDSMNVGSYWTDMSDYMIPALKDKFGHDKVYSIIGRAGAWKIFSTDISSGIKEELGIIAYYFSLNTSTNKKGGQYPLITTIVMEEMIAPPGSRELPDEFTLFMNLVSTIKRKRSNVNIYMLANTVSRNNQMLSSMGINVRDLTQGEVKAYQYFDELGNSNSVVVEYLRHYEQTNASESYFIFNRQEELAIIRGEWQAKKFQLFDEKDFYGRCTVPQLSICFDIKGIKLYVYINDDMEMYVSNRRLSNRVEYINVYGGKTVFSRDQYNIDSPQIKHMLVKLDEIHANKMSYFDSNLSGMDFEHILYGI